MPLYIKIDFCSDGLLGAWYTREEKYGIIDWSKTTTSVRERDVCDVLRSLANELNQVHKRRDK